MKTLKVKLLTGRSGRNFSQIPGEKVELHLQEAITLIDTNQAVAVNKAEYKSAQESLQSQQDEADELEAQIKALSHKGELTKTLRELYRDVAITSAALVGVVLNEEEINKFVEESMNGVPLFNANEN